MIRYLSLTILVVTLSTVSAQTRPPDRKSAQQHFPTPRAAVDAILDACKNNDSPALVRMLGDKYRHVIDKIDDAEERQHRLDFYQRAQDFLEIEKDGDDVAVMIIGRERWPLPIPLVKEGAGWRFDTEAGIEEMLARRIGENELSAIEVCQEYVRAQADYARIDRDGDEVREYAQKVLSTAGKQDGLYWATDSASVGRPSPLAAILPDAIEGLADRKPGAPYMGYHFKILTRQGSNLPGGKYDYVINGNMIAGFALVAWPAEYRESGVMTFLISHQSKLLEKDVGPDTAKLAEAMTEFNPDKSWKPVDEP